jgi:hypothetical protein
MNGINDIEEITDGIVNLEFYNDKKRTPFKILWILKEPYDDFDENGKAIGGGWSYTDDLNARLHNYSTIPTWRRIAYTSFGILNGFSAYKDIDDIMEGNGIFDVIRSIAVINVKKTPGNKQTPYKVLSEAYNRNRTILLEQIRTFNPNIIIGGGTLPLFVNDLNLEEQKKINNHDPSYYINDSKLYIVAYHPSYQARSLKFEEEYVDGIFSAVKNWKSENNV